MKRLDEIISLVQSKKGIIDVGTDHGYIPVHFALTGYPGQLIASDINEGPLSSARKIASAQGAADKITFSLSDGLIGCDPQSVDTIIIAGMGGDLICHILDAAEWTMDHAFQLILQPMTKAEVLRHWLTGNGYSIEEERLAWENNRLFKIFSACYSGQNTHLDDAELFTGRYEQIRQLQLCGELLAQEIKRMEKKYQGLSSSPCADGEKEFYKKILDQLTDMRLKHDKSK